MRIDSRKIIKRTNFEIIWEISFLYVIHILIFIQPYNRTKFIFMYEFLVEII